MPYFQQFLSHSGDWFKFETQAENLPSLSFFFYYIFPIIHRNTGQNSLKNNIEEKEYCLSVHRKANSARCFSRKCP